jgi:hypothetical protein
LSWSTSAATLRQVAFEAIRVRDQSFRLVPEILHPSERRSEVSEGASHRLRRCRPWDQDPEVRDEFLAVGASEVLSKDCASARVLAAVKRLGREA